VGKKKIKQIVNTKGELLKELELTPEEATQFDMMIEVDSSDGSVVCDICDKDYTASTLSGGFTFGSYAV
jgi:tRNA splicing ligase